MRRLPWLAGAALLLALALLTTYTAAAQAPAPAPTYVSGQLACSAVPPQTASSAGQISIAVGTTVTCSLTWADSGAYQPADTVWGWGDQHSTLTYAQDKESHLYATPGQFAIIVTATFCLPGNATLNLSGCTIGVAEPLAVTVVGPAATPTPTPGAMPAPTPSAAGPTVSYATGWNLVAGPAAQTFPGNGPLYTFQAGDMAYEVIPAGTATRAGAGYWANFSSATSLTLAAPQTGEASEPLPAGQWILIGNPLAQTATLSGADVVLGWDPIGEQYRAVSSLQPGQGAWAFSATGGALRWQP